MQLFILGRQPEIGLAELRAVFGDAELVLANVALVKTDQPVDIDRLGGVRKTGRVIWDQPGEVGKFLVDKLTALPPGKITLGISHYGKIASADSPKKTAVFLKKHLDRSVRFLPNQAAEISDAATLGNRLGTSPNKIELLMVHVGHRVIIAELTGVQNLNAYTLRDRGRPKRDARVGMLPPKLAQTMINLARGTKEAFAKTPLRATLSDNPTLLDPFCGTGVMLQEAGLMNLHVYGTDIDPRMVRYSHENLLWAERKFQREIPSLLAVADATKFNWLNFIREELDAKAKSLPFDLVVTETYLGQPYAAEPPSEKLQQNITTCNTIISKFLINLATQIRPEAGLCIAVPCWFLSHRTFHLPLVGVLTALGYEQIFYSDDQKPLVYHREGQVVGRELLVLHRKS